MSIIGRSIVIIGDITSGEDLRIDGQVNGHVQLQDAALTVGEHARVEADLRGTRVSILGTVRGAVSASARIELAASARVHGSLSANHVVIADGAQFNGQIDMDQRTIAAKVAQYKAPAQG
jgi:cytoskeletal protein CcmA (bactofilin family)